MHPANINGATTQYVSTPGKKSARGKVKPTGMKTRLVPIKNMSLRVILDHQGIGLPIKQGSEFPGWFDVLSSIP
jgi:hypothetical protein